MPESIHLEIDYNQRQIYRVSSDSRDIIANHLRPQEWQLITHMDECNQQKNYVSVVCDFDQLAAILWEGRNLADKRGDLTHLVLDLRRKLEPDPKNPKLLQTVPRKGYVLHTKAFVALDDLPPFVCGIPIAHPRHFFGRTYQIRSITNLWRPSAMQHAAVFGKRRSGKTSLLKYLQNIHAAAPTHLRPGQRNDWLHNPERYDIVLIDFLLGQNRTQEGLLSGILRNLRMQVPTPCNLSNFERVLEEELQNPTVILMDELEAALRATELDQPFWGSLRALGTTQLNNRLCFVISAQHRPELVASEMGKPSPFFNIFYGHEYELGPLTKDEAYELIDSAPEPFAQADKDWIYEKSQGWPPLLQLYCDLCFRAMDHQLTKEDWRIRAIQQSRNFDNLFKV